MRETYKTVKIKLQVVKSLTVTLRGGQYQAEEPMSTRAFSSTFTLHQCHQQDF